MANIVRKIKEQGIVIFKEHREAKEERTDYNGKVWPATDEKFIVDVVSCDEDDFNSISGMPNATRAQYQVNKDVFDSIKYLDKVNVKYQISQYGENIKITPETCVPLKAIK